MRYLLDTSPEEQGQSSLTINATGSNTLSTESFEFAGGGLTPGYFPSEFWRSLDFHTRDSEMRAYSFRWNKNIKDWVLYRKSEWSEPNRDECYTLENNPIPDEKLIPQNFKVERVACCTALSGFDNMTRVELLADSEANQAVRKDFEAIRKILPSGERSELFYNSEPGSDNSVRSIPPAFVYELTKIIDSQNVGDTNDYAYYMYKNKMYALSVILLRAVHEAFPDRVVTVLNLGNVTWELGLKKNACALYGEYRQKMVAARKGAKIPAYVIGRATCS